MANTELWKQVTSVRREVRNRLSAYINRFGHPISIYDDELDDPIGIENTNFSYIISMDIQPLVTKIYEVIGEGYIYICTDNDDDNPIDIDDLDVESQLQILDNLEMHLTYED